MKILTLLLAFLFIVNPVSAQFAPEKIQKDDLWLGRALSGLTKSFVFDTGDGASNKSIKLNTSKEFVLNSKVNVTGAVSASGAVSAGGAISTSSGNISTASGGLSVTGAMTGASSSVTGSSVHQSGVTMGAGANASKQITVDRAGFDPFMKWSETAQKWVYSNDGALEKNIGSGSGGDGGVNLLQNPSFEDGISVDWTSSGGTFSLQTYANPDPSGNDSFYARLVASAASQYLESTAHAIPTNLVGACLAKVAYNTSDAANWKIQIYDGSANLLKEETLNIITWNNGYASFACPTSGTTVKMRIISLAAGQIEVDKAHLGSENRTYEKTDGSAPCSVVQSFLTEAQFQAVRGSDWILSDGRSIVGSLCATVSGMTIAPDLRGVFFRGKNNSRADGNQNPYGEIALGVYTADKFQGHKHTITDPSHGHAAYGETAARASGSLTGWGINAGQSAPTAGVQPSATGVLVQDPSTDTVNGTPRTGLETAPKNVTGNHFIKINGATQIAMNPESQDWFVDANIGGANPSLSFSSVTSYSEIVDAGLDMVLNTKSAAAKIPCSTTNAASGLTCSSGSESLGAVFTNPREGLYEVCAAFSHYSNVAANGAIAPVFQLVETTPSTQTIIQEGKSRTGGYNNPGAGTAFTNGHAYNICGTFYFSSVAERTIRLNYEQLSAGTITSNSILIDRAASVGQRDMHIIVRPLLSAYNRPYLLPIFTAPTATVLDSGSGTYFPPAGVKYLRVKIVGAGGGGAGSGSSAGTAAGTGGLSSLIGGSFSLTANGGGGGSINAAGGAGGTYSITGFGNLGTQGGMGGNPTGLALNISGSGGIGGSSCLGGGATGGGGTNATSGSSAYNNTGAGGGGGGGGINGAIYGGSGGGAGGCINLNITGTMPASIAYIVGAAGTSGGAGPSGAIGGGGASGKIIIEEHYQ